MSIQQTDNEVVKEIDVYLSKALAENLFLLQYPTRPAYMLYDDVEHLAARIKPNQQKVELEVALDTHNPNYDKSKGEQIALNVDGSSNAAGEAYFESFTMDKQILTSTKSVASTETYALGLLKKGELHITPLHSILQMRPSFSYMDKSDTQSKKDLTAEDTEDEPEATAVTVRFEGPDSERAKKMKEKSYQFLQQRSANEPWITVSYHPFGSNRSNVECDMLVCSQIDRDATSTAIAPGEYLKELVPDCLRSSGYQTTDQEAEKSALAPHLALSDQIRHLMTNAHVLKFSKLLELLPSGIDPSNVERLLQQVAVLIQGCWVVKSELLFPKDSVSPYTGLNAETLVRARDYVIWHFTKSRYLTRSEIISVIYIPNEDLENMISQIANECDRGWEFRYPFDAEFVESHRAVEQRQDMLWDVRYKQLVRELRIGQSDIEGISRKPLLPMAPRLKQKRQPRNSLSEDGDESGTDTSVTKDPKLRKQSFSPRKRNNSTSSKFGGGQKPKYHIATLDVTPTYLESSPSDDIKIQLRTCVSEAMRSQFCMTLGEVKEMVAESHLGSVVTQRTDFDKLLEQALFDSGVQKLKNKWPQNTTPEPLYAFTRFGNKLDRYRNALLDLYCNTARSRINFLIKKVEDELGEIISEADSRQIFEDYCIYKSGYYYLKGTISLDS